MNQQMLSEKKELRRFYSARRKELTLECRKEFDTAVCRNIRNLPAYRQCECAGFFVAWGAEPDLHELFQEKRVFLPRFDAGRNGYQMVEIADPGKDLIPGKYGIPEPRQDLPAADSSFIREQLFFLVPAVACDRNGVRLGRGGGFYDRLLAGVKIPPVAVIYSCQMAPALPRAVHDCLMGAVVTETEILII